MGTTVYFESIIRDEMRKAPDGELELEFGTTSYRGPGELYIVANGVAACVDRETAKKLCQKMQEVASYLRLDEPD